jgi:hypothetical protein
VRNKDIDMMCFRCVSFCTHSRKVCKYIFCMFMYTDEVIAELKRMHKELLLSHWKIIQNKEITDKASPRPSFSLRHKCVTELNLYSISPANFTGLM